MNRSDWCLHLLILCATVIGTLGVVYGASASDIAHRRVVLENDHVRVNELFASPGAEAPMHLQQPGLLISLSKARFEMKAPDGEVTLVDYFPGEVLWKGESDRRSWKLLAGDAHVFFVEVTSAASGTTPEPAPLDVRDSTLLEPEQHNATIDNESPARTQSTDCKANSMLRAAVERKFESIGEALSKLSRAVPFWSHGVHSGYTVILQIPSRRNQSPRQSSKPAAAKSSSKPSTCVHFAAAITAKLTASV